MGLLQVDLPPFTTQKDMDASVAVSNACSANLGNGNPVLRDDDRRGGDICRKAGISQATYFNWKKKYEGIQPPEMRRLKQLEVENARLKKIVADLSLDREMRIAPRAGDALRRLPSRGLLR